MRSISRRGFLATTTAATAAALLPLGTSLAGDSEKPAGSITFGFSTYGMKGVKTEAALQLLADIGFDSVELAAQPGWDAEPKLVSPPRRRDLRQLLLDKHLKLTALMEHLEPSPDARQHADAIERLKQVAELGHDLSPDAQPVIQTVLGGGRWDDVRQLFADRLQKWVEVCQAAQTVLAIKPHRNGAMSRPEEAIWLIEQIGQPRWLRMVYDYSHYAFRDMPLEQTVKTSLPHIAHVAIKDAVLQGDRAVFVLPGESGGFDYAKLFKLLHDGGYRGDVCCEVSGMVSSKPGYDPIAAAKTCYQNIAPAFERAGIRRAGSETPRGKTAP